jgi:uncharacterized protein (TIGR00369 family)
MDWTRERTTLGDLMNGGAIMALAGTSKTNFLTAVRAGAVTAKKQPLQRGRTLTVLETEVAREDGKLAAQLTQTQLCY